MTLAADLRRIADYMDRIAEASLESPGERALKLDAEGVRQAAAALDAREWVKCSESLPERGRQVLCAYQRSVFAGFNLGAGEGWWDENGSHTEVDHWMPLPLPPEPEPTDAAE